MNKDFKKNSIVTRDKNGHYTELSCTYSDKIHNILKPIFKQAMEAGMSYDSFFYLVTSVCHEMIVKNVLGIGDN